jgi:DNA-binding XRE family transcriptional regulator
MLNSEGRREAVGDPVGEVRFDGEKFRAARERADIAREVCALKIGRKYPTIAAYEDGRVQPPITVAAALADLVGVDLDELLSRAPVAVAA